MADSVMGMLKAVSAAVDATVAKMTAAVSQVSQQTEVIKQRLDDMQRTTQEAVTDVNDKTRRAVGDISLLIDKMNGPWAEEIKLNLDLIRTGGEGIDDFLTKFGQAVIQTQDGTKTIRQLLEGVDLKGFATQVNQLVLDIKTGGKSIADGLEYLKLQGGKLTETFVKMVEAFKAGNISLSQVEAALAALKKLAGPDSALGDLGDAILSGVRTGSFG